MPAAPVTGAGGDLVVRTALRNVGRNRRRSWLTAGGIAFAVLLITFGISLQDGSYVAQRENATGLLTGHLQVVHPERVDSGRFEHLLNDVSARVEALRAHPQIRHASARVEAYALASVGERSFAAQVFGMDLAAEADMIRFFDTLQDGRVPAEADEVLIGTGLARNLGAELGDEIVLLGSGKHGGVAAMAVTVSGLFQTGIADLDRAVLIASLAAVQSAYYLEDEAHTIVALGDEPTQAGRLARELGGVVGADALVRSWQDIMPEIEQAIELDRVSGDFMYGIIMLLVGFSIVNTFIMVVFERTREFGMLLALGLRPWSIIRMVQIEAFGLWLLGTLLGLLLAAPLLYYLATSGFSLGAEIEEMAEQMYMPSRLYAAATPRALLTAPLVMLVATQLAALLPSLRLLKMQPVVALRHET